MAIRRRPIYGLLKRRTLLITCSSHRMQGIVVRLHITRHGCSINAINGSCTQNTKQWPQCSSIAQLTPSYIPLDDIRLIHTRMHKGARNNLFFPHHTTKTYSGPLGRGGGGYETSVSPPKRHPISYIEQTYTKSYIIKGHSSGRGLLQST